MKEINQASQGGNIKGLLFLLILFFLGSCASIPELQVQYRLPSPSDRLEGRHVELSIEDQRASKSVLSKGAAKEFEGFSGSISLTIAESGNEGVSAGIFQVPSLMREAFARRLENMGVKVLFEKTPGVPTLTIVLKEFSLDLEGRQWVASMGYDARLTGEKGAVATQFINGKAERYKLIGREGADTLMGEIFTDMINSLDLGRLFEQAGLSSVSIHQ